MTILDEIVANTRIEVAERKQHVSIADLEGTEAFGRTPYRLKEFLIDPSKTGIIAEIKKQSPSKGVINANVTVEEVGKGYEGAGASAISVLTDHKYFGGNMDYLKAVRKEVAVPILRKDFMVDEFQVIEAKSIGADIILLIAACLTKAEIQKLGGLAQSLGLSVLLEVHNEEELEKSICQEIDVVGVNNRNLKTFDVSIQTSLDLVDKIPDDFVKVSESGLKDGATIRTLKTAGYRGFLIGETFMKTEDPAKAMRDFVNEINKAS